ncbi:MAG: hypothetical protein M0Z42_18860 [Actinomycetota bacterium]|jgi:hypothetical protein|nr:hypothetical protein [Actinomycetota bacterium]
MAGKDGRIGRVVERNDDARRARSEIEGWLAGRGATVMVVLLVGLVVALVLGLAHV